MPGVLHCMKARILIRSLYVRRPSSVNARQVALVLSLALLQSRA